MSLLRTAALAALLTVATSGTAFAHNGVVHAGCPYGRVFTAGAVKVTGAFIPAIPKGAPTAAAYMQITSSGDADTLTGATSLAGTIGFHQMKSDGNVMQMVPIEGGLPVPAGSSVSLDPMAYHLMITGMTQPFIEGQCVEMTLHFAKAGDLPIELNIGPIGARTAPTAPPAGGSPSASTATGGMEMSGMSSMPGM
jgi:periplasmic copper chaperone A